MQKIVPVILLTFGLLNTTTILQSQCYELVWADEFNYSGNPNPSFWTAEVGAGGWGNNERQYYTSGDTDNALVENGVLTITAIREEYSGAEYTSARLITRGKLNVQYGKIEARMKLPYGQGIWPAFWMLGENITDVGWPACGEIDIMELIGGGDGRDNRSHGTAHWDNNGSHASYGGSYTLESGIFADSFHTFSIEWTPEFLRWYVDGIQFHVMDITGAGLSEFHQDFFILLNLAVGGNWPGYPDATTVFPQKMEVDYVRVYKKSTEIEEMSVAGDSELMQHAANKTYSLPYSPDWSYNWSVPEGAEIISAADTSEVTINWGCTDGVIACTITGACQTYEITKNIVVVNNIQGPMFIAPEEEDVLFHIDSVWGTTISWQLPGDALVTSGVGSDSLIASWGETYENVQLTLTNSCGTTTLELATTRAGQYPFPDIEVPHRIPGIIEATSFDYGGAGVSYYDRTAGNNGNGPRQDTDVDTENNDGGSPNIGWIESGEWIEFTVKIDSSSYYKIDFRAATSNVSGGPFSLLFNNVELLSSPAITNTGGWSSFKTLNAGTIYLTEQDTLMRIEFDNGGFNLGKITFTPSTKPDNIELTEIADKVSVYPQPADEVVTVRSESLLSEVALFDLNGRMIQQKEALDTNEVLLDLSAVPAGIYILHILTARGNKLYKKVLKTTQN